jgi:hypothetical protein
MPFTTSNIKWVIYNMLFVDFFCLNNSIKSRTIPRLLISIIDKYRFG